MKPRAFVIMPFGKSVKIGDDNPEDIVDFSKVYDQLLAPALRQAGCIPCRADEEMSAGDIRTDMFFELVTAEIVVADISALNANVFYELGVRNGVCPRGVFLVRGDWPWSRPFDVAPDRNFTYKGEFYLKGNKDPVPAGEIQQLAKILKQAIKTDPQAVGSPVYAHLPGLKPPDINCIQTSKARYFTALQDNWLELVRLAQNRGQPGHILTLAEEAPSPVHRVRILYEAAKALIGLCRYRAAKQVLDQLLAIQPDHADARLQQAIVLEHLGLSLEAEDQIRRLLHKSKDEPNASDILGQVYRQLWRLSWNESSETAVPEGRDIPKRARENYALAATAFQYFWRAQESHPEAYFSGFNAVVLLALIDHIFADQPGKPGERLPAHRPADFGSLQLSSVIPAVRFSAECARRRAAANGDHDQQFWSTTSLSGLALIEPGASSENRERAVQLIRDACAFPQTTLFHMEILKQRLMLLRDLNFELEFAKEAIAIVENSIRLKRSGCECQQVIVFFGGKDRDGSNRQLPDEAANAVDERMRELLNTWGIGKNDLAITGGIRDADLLFAKACRDTGAKVQILLLDPSPTEMAGEMWQPSDKWADVLHELATDRDVQMLCHDAELGTPLNPSQAKGRHNRWLMNTARLAAESAQGSRLYGIVFSDGDPPPNDLDDPAYLEHPAFFIAGIRTALGYQGKVEVINPTTFLADGRPPSAPDNGRTTRLFESPRPYR